MIKTTVAIVGDELPAQCRRRQKKAETGEDRQSQMRYPIGEHSRLGVGLIEENEIPQATEAEPRIPKGLGIQVGQRPIEENP